MIPALCAVVYRAIIASPFSQPLPTKHILLFSGGACVSLAQRHVFLRALPDAAINDWHPGIFKVLAHFYVGAIVLLKFIKPGKTIPSPWRGWPAVVNKTVVMHLSQSWLHLY